jgi:hypothetical protein
MWKHSLATTLTNRTKNCLLCAVLCVIGPVVLLCSWSNMLRTRCILYLGLTPFEQVKILLTLCAHEDKNYSSCVVRVILSHSLHFQLSGLASTSGTIRPSRRTSPPNFESRVPSHQSDPYVVSATYYIPKGDSASFPDVSATNRMCC